MLVLSYVPALLFLALAGAANVLFALSLSVEPRMQLFWIGAAVSSTLWTVAGPSTVQRQLASREYVKGCTAAVLLALALGYDALAAYGLSRAEQRRETATTSALSRALDTAERDEAEAARRLAAVTPALPVGIAQAALDTAKGAKAHAEATRDLARAREHATASADLRASRERVAAAISAIEQASQDARTDVLPPGLVAWLPVVLVTLGALGGLFSVTGRAPPIPVQPEAPREPAAEPASVDLLSRLYRSRPSPLRVDADGYLRGTQRQMAAQANMSPPKFNRLLHAAAEQGAIALDTSDGTGFKPRAR